MQKQTQFFSVDRAATLLGYNRRTVAKALDGVEPTTTKVGAKKVGRKTCALRTISRALLEPTVHRNRGSRG